MRKLPLSVAISVIVHVGVLVYVVLCVRSRARADAPASRIAMIAAPTSDAPVPAMEVALLDDVPAAVAFRVAQPPPTSPTDRGAHGAHVTVPDSLADPAAGAADDSRAERLVMRHGEPDRADMLSDTPSERVESRSFDAKAAAADALDALGHAQRVTRPASAGSMGEPVDPRGFDAKVAADGTVQLTDKPSVRFVLPGKQALTDYLHSDNTLGGPAGDPAIAGKYEAAPGTAINLGTSSSINAGSSSASFSHNVDGRGTVVVVPLIGGQFDAGDALMRRHGTDPNRARKLKFLDATRDERAQLGSLNRTEQLAHASDLMQRNLDALWLDAKLDLAAKKRALFELWDECAEAGDSDLLHGASDARRLVIDFIRGHLPAGSAGAYTPGELATLSRHRQSKAVFQPYDE